MLLLPLLLALPGKFFFISFFIYLLLISSIYSTEQVLDKSGVSIAPVTTSNYYQITACTRVRYWASYQ